MRREESVTQEVLEGQKKPKGYAYKCKCGWFPKEWVKNKPKNADSHWKRCQGIPCPGADKTLMAEVRKYQQKVLTADERIARDQKEFQEWKAKLQKDLAAATCAPFFDVPVQSPLGKSFAYCCTQCSRTMTRAKFMWNACSKAEKPMKKKTWQRQVRGRVAQQFSPKYGTSAQAKEYQKKQARKWMKDWREVPANAEKIRKWSKKRMEEMRKKPEVYRAFLDKAAKRRKDGTRRGNAYKVKKPQKRTILFRPEFSDKIKLNENYCEDPLEGGALSDERLRGAIPDRRPRAAGSSKDL